MTNKNLNTIISFLENELHIQLTEHQKVVIKYLLDKEVQEHLDKLDREDD